jgi:hypothetical protein
MSRNESLVNRQTDRLASPCISVHEMLYLIANYKDNKQLVVV